MIAEIALPPSEFALYETFGNVPGVTFEIEGVVAHSAEYVMPQMRASTSDVTALRSVLTDDPTVADAHLLSGFGGQALFWMEWGEEVHEAVALLAEGDTTILSARASDEAWQFRVLSGSRDSFSEIYDSCHDGGLPVEIQTVHERTTLTADSHGLTQQQYETLKLAIDRGYYDIPRKVTMKDLAEELGVSHQAISERLRRGHRGIVKSDLSPPS